MICDVHHTVQDPQTGHLAISPARGDRWVGSIPGTGRNRHDCDVLGRGRRCSRRHRHFDSGPQGRGKTPSAGYGRPAPQRGRANGHTFRIEGTAWRCATCGNHVPRREGELYGPAGGSSRRPPPRGSGSTSLGLRSWVRASSGEPRPRARHSSYRRSRTIDKDCVDGAFTWGTGARVW